jgi:ATP adenylyltransferase
MAGKTKKFKVSPVKKKKGAAVQKKKRIQKNKSTDQTDFINLAKQVWPIERDIFFRPARLKYVRRIMIKKDCVFCEATQAEINVSSLCLYKTKYSQIIVNKYPYNSGHLLILPLRHCGDLLSLASEEYNDLHQTLRLATEGIVEVYKPNGYNIGLNNGATAGAGIPDHIHFHIVPRWNGDLNFFPLIAETKLVVETAEETYHRLAVFFLNKKGIL